MEKKRNIVTRTFSLTDSESNVDKDKEKRTLSLSFSSEVPVRRYDGWEILGHSEDEIDLSFLRGGSAPVLFNHNDGNVVGVVEHALVEEGRGKATIRFSRNRAGEDVWNDIEDGILSNVSVGYAVDEVKPGEKMDGIPSYRVSRWTPLEVSIVSIPADRTVGVGRSETLEETSVTNTEETTMTDTTENQAVDTGSIEIVREEVRKNEASRIRTIYSIGEKFGYRELADKYVSDNKSVDEFRTAILDTMTTKPANTVAPSHIDFSAKEERAYSISRAIRASLTKDWSDAGLEREAHRELVKRFGDRETNGILIPHNVFHRAMTAAGAATGKELVGTDHTGYIPPLYNSLAVVRAGATVLPGLRGNVDIPKMGSSTAYWVTEDEAVTDSTPATASVTLSPKTVGGLVYVSRKLLLQSEPTVDQLLMNDLRNVIAVAVDAAAIAGSAGSGEPRGILNTSGIGASTGLTQGAPTWAMVHQLISAVESENLMGNVWLTNPLVVSKLSTTAKISSTDSVMIMNEKGVLAGYPVISSNNVPAAGSPMTSSLIFGDFSHLLIGEWSVIEVAASDSDGTTFQKGGVTIRAMTDIDIAVRYAQAFAAAEDIRV